MRNVLSSIEQGDSIDSLTAFGVREPIPSRCLQHFCIFRQNGGCSAHCLTHSSSPIHVADSSSLLHEWALFQQRQIHAAHVCHAGMLTRASKSLKETWHNAAHPEPCSSSSPPTDGEGCVTAAFAGSAGSPESVGEAQQSQLRKERTKSKARLGCVELAAAHAAPARQPCCM